MKRLNNMKKIIMVMVIALMGCSSPDSEWICNCEQNVELDRSIRIINYNQVHKPMETDGILRQYRDKVKTICELREVSTIDYSDTCLVVMTNMD